jgi:hypothetical protein
MLALRRNDTRDQIEDQTEAFEFEKLSDDLQMKVLCKALFGDEKLSSVNKSWRKMIKGIIHSALPMHKRDELIQGLYYRVIRFGNNQENERMKNLISIYQNNEALNSKSAVKFLCAFLKPNNIEDSCEDQNSDYESEYDSEIQSSEDESKIEKIKEMIKAWDLNPTINCLTDPIDPIAVLKSLLHNRKIEEAFALAARMDEDKFAYSILIQEYLLDCKNGLGLSLDQAYKLTEALNTKKTRISALTAFVIVGCQNLVIPEKPTKISMKKLLQHPFIIFIENNEIKNLPKFAVFHLIQKINSLSHREYKSFEASEISCKLIKKLFKVIPTDFDFYGESEIDSEECSDLIDHYQNLLYEKEIVPMSDRLMEKATADEFINAINAIPHSGLKKQIFETIMGGFYAENPNMLAWLQIIEHIERETNQLPKAFQQLVLQYLIDDLKKFIANFDKVDNFSRLIAFLKGCPGWFKRFELCSEEFQEKYDFKNAYDRALNIYKSVIKLLIDHDEKELSSQIIENVESKALKNELKNHFKELNLYTTIGLKL